MTDHSGIHQKLIEFQNRGVPNRQIGVLRKLYELREKILAPNKISGANLGFDGKMLPPDNYVDETHYIHDLAQDVYRPTRSNFAQCIMINSKSMKELPIDKNSSTLKIDYTFKDTRNHKIQMEYLKRCKEIDLPIGVLLQLSTKKYFVLGLAKITSISNTVFSLEPYGLEDGASISLKEKILSKYTKSNSSHTRKIPNVDYVKLISKVKDDDTASENIDYRSKPDQVNISTILNYCERHQWVIPDFQRFYDWDRNQIKKFLNSVFYGYYVGSFLIWIKPEDFSIGTQPIIGVNNSSSNSRPYGIILDGQQRITSLYYAIKSPQIDDDKIKSFFYINFSEYFSFDDPEEIIEISSKELEELDCFKKLLFPFNQLHDSENWIYKFEDYLTDHEPESKDDIRRICRRISRKLSFIKSQFTISYITLEDMPIEHVIRVFERINTTGKQLDAFDLLIAKISKHKIKLRDEWKSVCKKHDKLFKYFDEPRGSTKGLTIIHSMALCHTTPPSCKNTYVLNIFDNIRGSKDDFLDKWNLAADYVNDAITRLEDKAWFGVRSKKWLTSESIIPVMASLLWLINTKYKDNKRSCYEKLRQWYWISVFSNAYSGASDTQKGVDYSSMVEWFETGEIPKVFQEFQEEFDRRLDLSDVTNARGSEFRGILSLLVLSGAKDWVVDDPIPDPKLMDSEVNVDHIFPKSEYNDELVESILNKTWLRKRTNQKDKRAKHPSTVIEQIMGKNSLSEEKLKDTLRNHFISEEAFQALRNNDFKKFVHEREKTILKEIADRIGSTKDEAEFKLSTSDI